MKNTIGCAVILVIAALANTTAATATTIDLGTFLVSPQGTFLYQSVNDTCDAPGAPVGCSNSPTFIDLGKYIGDTITITDVGSLCTYTAAEEHQSNCTFYPASASYLGGVFSSNTTLLGPSNLIRLPGEVSAGLPNINTAALNSFNGNVNTTVPDDFYLPATVVVPAQYLVVGTLDSAYIDNTGTTPPTFGVDITVNTDPPTIQTASVPEPGTAGFSLIGAALMWISGKRIAGSARWRV